MSIRTKLILWYSGLLTLIIIVFGGAVFGVLRWTLTSTIDRSLESTIDQVRQRSRASVIGQFGAPDQVTVYLPELDTFGLSGVLVQVWNLSEFSPTLIDSSTNIATYTLPLDRAALDRAAQNPQQAQYSNIIKTDTEWRVATQALDIWGRRVAIQVATSSQAIKEASAVLVIIMGAAVAVSMLGSVLISLWIASRALSPIVQITEAADRIASTDDLSTRLTWSGPTDELGRLTSVFNRMMTRLEHLFSVQKRFVGDVSHELRTPLTAIRGNIDLIKRYGMDGESLDAIESEVDRMARMVNDLLLLARADYGGLTLDLEPLDLDTVVSEVYRESKILAKDRDLKVKIGDFEPLRIEGHGDRMKQLLLNLVSNAIKFTPDGGTITLNLRLDGVNAVLEVVDTGIGISTEDKARIFDRFFQADQSRARRRGDGVGLGLSIARWIVDAHHGTISVDSEVGRGTTFRVTIPALGVLMPGTSQVTRPRITLIRRPTSGQRAALHTTAGGAAGTEPGRTHHTP